MNFQHKPKAIYLPPTLTTNDWHRHILSRHLRGYESTITGNERADRRSPTQQKNRRNEMSATHAVVRMAHTHRACNCATSYLQLKFSCFMLHCQRANPKAKGYTHCSVRCAKQVRDRGNEQRVQPRWLPTSNLTPNTARENQTNHTVNPACTKCHDGVTGVSCAQTGK